MALGTTKMKTGSLPARKSKGEQSVDIEKPEKVREATSFSGREKKTAGGGGGGRWTKRKAVDAQRKLPKPTWTSTRSGAFLRGGECPPNAIGLDGGAVQGEGWSGARRTSTLVRAQKKTPPIRKANTPGGKGGRKKKEKTKKEKKPDGETSAPLRMQFRQKGGKPQTEVQNRTQTKNKVKQIHRTGSVGVTVKLPKWIEEKC